ncbi:restriction endonuclease subunit S [Pontiellaceae bacterium B1224]|nr:restriction endonuclease subunit S [Pontiellaceae bacterium B1224]
MDKQTAQLLEHHFDTAFAAPDGIKKLRELILTLAMQGKLVEQDPNDPPASELLKGIESEKQRLIKEKKIKKPKPLPPIKPEEVPYELPQGWEWVRLGEIGIWKSGSTPSRSNSSFYGGDIPWVKSGEVKQGRIRSTEETITQVALDKCPLQINEKGSVLVAMYGANIGEVGILEIEAATNQAVCACKTYTNFDENYLLNLITSLKPYFINQGAGAAQPNISREKIVSTIFPLPPLPEQHRIVERIDQLMARCDELEKLRKEREEKRLAVHAAAIKQLLNPKLRAFVPSCEKESSNLRALPLPSVVADPADRPLPAAVVSSCETNSPFAFLARHFGELYTVKENVAELRKAILQLAVMGRLVPQNPNDPPARELLKEIEAEKKRVSHEGTKTRRKEKKLPPIKPEEVPYELPQGWGWVMVEDVFNTTSGTTFDASLERENGEYAYVKVGDMNLPGNDLIITTSSRFVDPDKKMLRALIPSGSVIFPKRGGAIATNKKRIINDPCFVDLNIMAISPTNWVLTTYAYQWLSTIDLATLNTGTSVPQINHKDINPLPFPLPPLPEQHRIVERIDQLMALCDRLDQQIDDATRKQTELLNAVMAQV